MKGKMKLHFDKALFEENLEEAIERAMIKLMPNTTDAEKQVKVKELAPDIQSEIESFATEAVKRAFAPKSTPPPVLDFGRIQLFAYDAGQPCAVAEHRSFQFGGDQTAGLVYVDKGHGFNAVEHSLLNESTWAWIKEWMTKGFASEGLIGEDGKLK